MSTNPVLLPTIFLSSACRACEERVKSVLAEATCKKIIQGSCPGFVFRSPDTIFLSVRVLLFNSQSDFIV
jgi:hypothetical protein